jgi:hypothetical protein
MNNESPYVQGSTPYDQPITPIYDVSKKGEWKWWHIVLVILAVLVLISALDYKNPIPMTIEQARTIPIRQVCGNNWQTNHVGDIDLNKQDMCLARLWIDAGCTDTGTKWPEFHGYSDNPLNYWNTITLGAVHDDMVTYRSRADGNLSDYRKKCGI